MNQLDELVCRLCVYEVSRGAAVRARARKAGRGQERGRTGVREGLDVERVRLAARLCNRLDPLRACVQDVSECTRRRTSTALERTLAGSATIMWQSMKTLSTVLLTLARTGAPMVMLGTKWPSMTSGAGLGREHCGRRRREGRRSAPMWTHSAPQCIMRLISFPRSAKLEARTEGETIARGEAAMAWREVGGERAGGERRARRGVWGSERLSACSRV